VTTLTATPQPGTALLPPSMLLQVAGAPTPPANAYASNFAAGVDGWTAAGGMTLDAPTNDGTSSVALHMTGPAGSVADSTASRALTGLSTSSRYRYRGTYGISRGEVRLIAKDTASGTVLAQTSFVAAADPLHKSVVLSLDFQPTAAAVTIQATIHQTTAYSSSSASIFARDITVQPLGTWQGTTIYRTDVNGTDVPVREDAGGLDVNNAGALTITDWEAALVGTVAYRVVDGTGSSVGPVAASHAEARRNLHPNPAARLPGAGWSLSPGPGGAAAVTWQTAGGPVGCPTFVRGTWSTSPTGTGNNGWNNGYAVCAPGQWAQARTWVRSSVAQRMTIYLQYWSDTALIQSTNGGTIVTAPNVWQPLEFVAPNAAPPGTTRVLYLTYSLAGTGAVAWSPGDTLDGTLAQLEVTNAQPSAVAPYFDGSTSNVGTVRHAWVGNPDASPSIETAELVTGGVWLQLPATAVPSAGAAGAPRAVLVPMVTGYDGSRSSVGELQDVIGRADPIGSPGVLSTRAGTLELHARTYDDVRAVVQLLAAGDVAQLRQPSQPGLDLYMVGGRVDELPRTEQTQVLRWATRVAYREVSAP
jgi:hypothetical protein